MEAELLERIQRSNEERLANSREWVGSIFFVVAVGMVFYVLPIAILTAHVLPLRRCADESTLLASVKFATFVWFLLLTALYIVVSGSTGMLGFVVCTGLLAVWTVVMLFATVVSRCVRWRREASEKRLLRAQESEEKAATAARIASRSQRGSTVFDVTVAEEAGPLSPSRRRGSGSGDSPGDPERSPGANAGFGTYLTASNDHSGCFRQNSVSFAANDGSASFEAPRSDSPAATPGVGGNSVLPLKSPVKSPLEENGRFGSRRGSFGTYKMSPADITASMRQASLRRQSRKDGSVAGAGSRRGSVFGRHQRIHELDSWTCAPDAFNGGQVKVILVSLLMIVLILGVIFLMQSAWVVPVYKLIDSATGNMTTEFQPQLTAQALQFMYAFPGLATAWQMGYYTQIFTEYCGTEFRRALSAKEKETELLGNWITRYSINMSQYKPQDYRLYRSVNEWFIRPIDMSLRPPPNDDTLIVSPADCRMVIYQARRDVKIWLKGIDVSYQALVAGLTVLGSEHYFENGAMVIARLAPQDYHRFHSPVSGRIAAIKNVPGPYWSVSADAVRSGNDCLRNRRKVVIVDAGPKVGHVALVIVGATCVGSIVLVTPNQTSVDPTPLNVGMYVERGQEIGNFQFGGSTVVVLLPQGRIELDSTLVYRSRFPVETLIQVNQPIGRIR